MWNCLCECGNFITRSSQSLNFAIRNNSMSSCGCYKKERIMNLNKQLNTYDLSGQYGIGWTNNTNEEFYFDLEDYDKIKNYCWSVSKSGYVYTKILNKGKPYSLYLHRCIFNNLDSKFDVDHINHNKRDNRKNNLRICEHIKNCLNSTKRKDNTSGVKGVSYRKDRNKWRAEIYVNRKYLYLGSYDKFEDAVNARIKAENQYHKQFSFANSMKIAKENDKCYY